MKLRIAEALFAIFLAGFLATNTAFAQSIAYRRTILASDIPELGGHLDPLLKSPWGIAAVPGVSFTVATQGHAISLAADGSRVGSPIFAILNPAGTGPASPTAIVANQDSFFRDRQSIPPFAISTITATEDGGIYFWAINADSTFRPQANLVVDNSQTGAVYTGLAALAPDCCNPFLAVANFHSGSIESYNSGFDRLAPPGSFSDPNLPAGYAPFGMQVVAGHVFISYALQDADKRKPVFGAGNGIVSVFDLAGDFVRRFATGGLLNAPWGIAQASANFGPFSNDILIGNAGDGTISAFDPVTGNFAGQLKDSDGKLIVTAGLHALMFRSDGVGDANNLYFTAAIGNGQDGLFGTIQTGLVSTTRVSAPPTPAGTAAQISVTVSAGPGNSGTPKGMVTLLDGGAQISDAPLTDGALVFSAVLRGVSTHVITAQYSGDDAFLPSSSQTDVQVTGPATTLNLLAPANTSPLTPVTLTATIHSDGETPTGQIVFNDGNIFLGVAPLNVTGIATLTVNTLAVGAHALTASYDGNGTFGESTSTIVTTMVANRDFSVGANPPSTTVIAGQSATFSVMITPAGGFADPVTFSCPTLAGITCTFNPPTVTPVAGAGSTMLTVTTSAGVARYGKIPAMWGAGPLFASIGLLGMLAWFSKRVDPAGNELVRAAASAFSVVTLSLLLVSCGGYTTSGQTSHGTASITITAQSGAISHTTNVNVNVQ